MKTKRFSALTLILAGLTMLSAWQGAAAGTPEVLGTLKSRYPNTQFTEVKESGLPGIYEVYMGRNIAYTDTGGRLFLFGHLYDMAAQRDLTAERMDALTRVDFSTLPLQDAIKTVRGNGQKIVAVFSDPDCPYCKKLEQELGKIDNITIYTFLMPLEQLHPQAKSKAIAVWCSRDRDQTWRNLMLQGKTPTPSNCDNPIARNLALASSLGIQGTPTMVAGDGRTKPGAAPAEELSTWLDRADKVSEVRQ